jgi:hypothetical protein
MILRWTRRKKSQWSRNLIPIKNDPQKGIIILQPLKKPLKALIMIPCTFTNSLSQFLISKFLIKRTSTNSREKIANKSKDSYKINSTKKIGSHKPNLSAWEVRMGFKKEQPHKIWEYRAMTSSLFNQKLKLNKIQTK